MNKGKKQLFPFVLSGAIIVLPNCASGSRPSVDTWRRSYIPTHKEVSTLDFSIMELDPDGQIMKGLDSQEFVVLQKLSDGYEIAIRALYTYLGGEFEVYENDDNSLSVYYCVLGDEYEELHKAALKVFVKQLPKAIYVFCDTVA